MNASSALRLPPIAQHGAAEALGRGAVEDAGLLERRERVGREHLGPLVAVVARRVAAAEDVRERVREAVVGRRLDDRDLAPHLVEDLLHARAALGRVLVCSRKSNSANSIWRTIASPARNVRERFIVSILSRGSGAPVSIVPRRCRASTSGRHVKFSMNWLGSSTASHATPLMPAIDG